MTADRGLIASSRISRERIFQVNWRTSPLIVSLRGIGRRLGVNQLVAALTSRGRYEEAFDVAFARTLRSGDVVWDVGANVGYYTTRFAASVGEQGTVVAFEPSLENFIRLTQACVPLPNVRLLNLGLGRRNETVRFEQGADSLGATSRIVSGESGVPIELRSGASAIEELGLPQPNAIKLDVEGYELEVIEGLGPVLASPGLRVIGIEVHFRILQERGMLGAPRRIEALLKAAGFTVAWQDSSHLLSQRHPA